MPRGDGRKSWKGSQNPNFGKDTSLDNNPNAAYFEYKGEQYHSFKTAERMTGASRHRIKRDPSFRMLEKPKKVPPPKVVKPRKPKLDTTDLQSKFGLTHKDVMKFRGRWRSQGYNVRGRKDANGVLIEFKIGLEDWMRIWIDSGHWAQRGAGTGKYVMSRYNDLGHYEVGNVFIQLHTDNTKETAGKRTYPGRNKGHTVSQETRDKLSVTNGTPFTLGGVYYHSMNEAQDKLNIGRVRLLTLMRSEGLTNRKS